MMRAREKLQRRGIQHQARHSMGQQIRATYRGELQTPAYEPQLCHWLWTLIQVNLRIHFPQAMGKIPQGDSYAKAQEKHWVVLAVIMATKELKRHFLTCAICVQRRHCVFLESHSLPFFTVKSCEMKRIVCVRVNQLRLRKTGKCSVFLSQHNTHRPSKSF